MLANIGSRESLKRRFVGYTALASGAALVAVLLGTGAPRWVRLVVFAPFWLAGLGLLQAREKV